MKILLKYLILLCLLLFSGSSKAQIDSLLQVHVSQTGQERAQTELSISVYYIGLDSIIQAHEYASAALEWAQESNDPEFARKALNFLGYIYLHWDDYHNAIASFYEALEISRMTGNTRAEANALHGLCRAYGENGNLEQGKEAAESGMALAAKIGDTAIVAVLHNSLGTLYSQAGKYDEALVELKEFLRLSDLIGDRRSKVYALNNIGENYLKTANYKLAELYLLRAFNENEEIGDAQAKAATLGNLGDLEYRRGNLDKAREYVIESTKVSEQQGFKQYLIDSYRVLAEIEEMAGNFEEAYRYSKAYAQQRDSLYSETRQKQIDELILRFEKSEDKQRMALLEEKSRNQNLWFTLSIVGVVLGLIVFVLILVSFRLKIKLQRQETEELTQTIDEQNRELSSALMQSSQLREVFMMIDENLKKIQSGQAADDLTPQLSDLRNKVKTSLDVHDDWESIKLHFDKVHPEFFSSLQRKYPTLTRYDLKLCAYIRMNLSTKDIARLLNISDRAVQTARYRIKKKIDLSRNDDLITFIRDF